MTIETARTFAALHVKGDPVILYNVWDAGSARAVEAAGATALATGSWSLAAAHGYRDGEAMPFALVETIVDRITASTGLPLSVDFESGYAEAASDVADNLRRLIRIGVVGVNFEDGSGADQSLHPVERQAACIAAMRDVAVAEGIPVFINARTDHFLIESDATRHPALVDAVIARGLAYDSAGADGFFVPGLTDEALIGQICAAVPLPVNVMITGKSPPLLRFAELGVARVSHGPGPYRKAMSGLTEAARAAFAERA
ncbi:isocitrate lyase/PEP mutase family protein [Rhizobium halophytocola]|uniref:2-methylisocitrate lyase-like PEP mutase family enzyme n=1 Tax=Rhizobium halophytocola TaxID=735519 RepID=A0ABS4DYT3_9HYPH|nr:2-methylisocitrate lyase-like PEP mutase family enzyme [Rhizobium halophytocola]